MSCERPRQVYEYISMGPAHSQKGRTQLKIWPLDSLSACKLYQSTTEIIVNTQREPGQD
jgi:hypothetical protein